MDKYSLSEDMFKQVIKLSPRHAAAYNYLGYSWADRGIRLGDSYKMIQKALEIEPYNGAYIDSLGWVLYQQGKYQQALQKLKQAAKALEDPVIFEHLGDTYRKLRLLKKALRAYQKALRLNPANQDIKEKINSLKKSD